MKHGKKLAVISAMVLSFGVASLTVYAASAATPAQAAAEITGRTTESITQQRLETGTSYCAIAADAGKLDEYKQAVLQIRKDALAQRVADGLITQAQADAWLEAYKAMQANCDGTQSCGAGGAGCGLAGGGLGGGCAGGGMGGGGCLR